MPTALRALILLLACAACGDDEPPAAVPGPEGPAPEQPAPQTQLEPTSPEPPLEPAPPEAPEPCKLAHLEPDTSRCPAGQVGEACATARSTTAARTPG